jgi:hypothetical protein
MEGTRKQQREETAKTRGEERRGEERRGEERDRRISSRMRISLSNGSGTRFCFKDKKRDKEGSKKQETQ